MSDTTGIATTVADVMLRRPKTLPATVTVAEAREAFGNVRVQMLLIADQGRFLGAVSRIPETAAPDELAVAYANEAAPRVSMDASLSDALELLEHRPHGRIVVVDDDERLVGLVCVARDGVSFCGVEDDGS